MRFNQGQGQMQNRFGQNQNRFNRGHRQGQSELLDRTLDKREMDKMEQTRMEETIERYFAHFVRNIGIKLLIV